MLEALIGPLVSGGMSLLGGLFNKKKDNRAHNKAVWKSNRAQVNEANRKEIAWNQAVEKKAQAAGDFFMKEAGRLGINPITYLNGGGLSHAFSVATIGLQKPAFSYHIRPEEGYQSTGQTTGETIQGAFSSFGSALASSLQQSAQNDFQKELVGLQLQAANRLGNGTTGKGFNNVIPAAVYSGSVRSSGAGNSGIVGPAANLHSTKGEVKTAWGSVFNPVPYDRARGELVLGSTVNDVAEPVLYAPTVLSDERNIETAKNWYWDSYKKLAPQVVRLGSYAVNPWGWGAGEAAARTIKAMPRPTPQNSRMMQREMQVQGGGNW